LERATACFALIYVLNAEALAFDGESNEEVRTRILILDTCRLFMERNYGDKYEFEIASFAFAVS
jgi:hypothetical protein